MSSVNIRRDRTGSTSQRRPSLMTQTTSSQTILRPIAMTEENADFRESPRTSESLGRRSPANVSALQETNGQHDDRNNSETAQVSGSVHDVRRGSSGTRNRSRTIDCILGPSADPRSTTRTRQNTSAFQSSDPASVNLILPEETKREIEEATHKSEGYPPPRKSTDSAHGQRSRNGSVSWVKQTLGMNTEKRGDEEAGLTEGYGAQQNRSRRNSKSESQSGRTEEEELHHDDVVDHLNVIDAEVSAVTYFQDTANAIMLPPIPTLWKRKATISLPTTPTGAPTTTTDAAGNITVDSGSTEDLLDTHVKDVLSKKQRSPKKEWFIRSMKGAWAFVKTPVGVITAIYGFLVVFWGAAIVLFLLGWIDVGGGDTKDKWVEISSQVVNGLFTLTGVGFIPWRVRDAYRISAIWRLQHIDRKLRTKKGLPALADKNDAPDPEKDEDFVQVLTDHQQERLKYQQRAFQKSQTWYRPHATDTHRAFSLNWALAICLFTIGNSAFQCILCGCMWGLDRHERPAWTTGSLIPLSFGCGIASAILIWKGGDRSKKTAAVEKKLRDALGMEDDVRSVDSKAERQGRS